MGTKMVDRRILGMNVRKAREKAHLTQEQLAKAIGVTHPTINRLENGKQNVTLDVLDKISKRLGVEPYSFFSKDSLVPYLQVREEHAVYHTSRDEMENVKYFEDPLSLGPGTEISEIPPSEYLPFLKRFLPRGYKSDPDRIVAFPTAGISMRPTIFPGSIVWIDRKDIQPKEGEIYAFWLADRNTVTVKRLIKINKRYCIIDGDNRDAEDRKSEELRDFPMVIDCKEYEEGEHPWPIRGRVIWILNRLIEEPKR